MDKDKTLKFQVSLTGNILPECDREEVLGNLANIFNSTPKRMEKLLQGKKVSLKKQFNEDQAAAVCKNIRDAGAQCEAVQLVEIDADSNDADVLEIPGSVSEDNGFRMTHDSADDEESRLGELIMAYVDCNTQYYQDQFSKFGKPDIPEFRLGWHWPAFFYFFFWAMYRKLWGYGILYITVAAGFAIFMRPGVLSILWLLVWPLVINHLYFRRAIKAAKLALHQPEQEAKIMNRGGVSKAAVWISVIAFVVLIFVTSSYVTNQFLEEYGDQIQDVLPGSGSQLRGDGSAFDNVDVNQKELSKTSITLSYLATLLKVLLVTDDDIERQETVASYYDHLEGDKIKDSWGNKIKIVEEASRYILMSAGPDRTFETDDDILQTVNLP